MFPSSFVSCGSLRPVIWSFSCRRSLLLVGFLVSCSRRTFSWVHRKFLYLTCPWFSHSCGILGQLSIKLNLKLANKYKNLWTHLNLVFFQYWLASSFVYIHKFIYFCLRHQSCQLLSDTVFEVGSVTKLTRW